MNREQVKTEDESWRLAVLTFLFLPQPAALAHLCRAVLVPALTPDKGSPAEAYENQSQAHTGMSGMDACHGRGTISGSQHPNMLVRTVSWKGTEQFFHFFFGTARLHREASSPVKNLPIKHRNSPAWHGGWEWGMWLKTAGRGGRTCFPPVVPKGGAVRILCSPKPDR